MTDKQPEALTDPQLQIWAEYCAMKEEVARLHELNAELVEALRLIQPIQCDNLHHEKKHRHGYSEACPVKEWIDEVITRATGETALQRLNKAAEDNGEEL